MVIVVTLLSFHSRFVCAERSDHKAVANRWKPDKWEYIELVHVQENFYALKSIHKFYLHVLDDHTILWDNSLIDQSATFKV